MASDSTSSAVDTLAKDLPELSVNMRMFSLCMRSLYAEQAISSSVENGSKFIRLRDDTRNDAIVYLKGVMPLNEVMLLKLQEFFEYYESLEFEEWKECVADILEEVEAYQQGCEALVKIHEDLMTTLKEREDKAKVLCKEFGELDAKYEREMEALKASAKGKKGWAFALAFVPGVNVIATPLLNAAAADDLAQSVAKHEQRQIVLAATKVVSTSLIPAIKHFIEGLQIIAGFFNIMRNELKGFEKMESKKKMHYITLKKKSAEVKSGCRAFHAVLPSVKSDFAAIPSKGTDTNYVDRWLAKQKKTIEETCKQKLSLTFMFKALASAVSAPSAIKN